MYPFLFGIKWLDMYVILMIAGMFAAILFFKFVCGKKKVDDKTYNFYSLLAIVSIAVGVVSAFLFQSIYNWIESGFKAFKLGGLTFMGGLIGGVATFVLGTVLFAKGEVKRNFWQIANYAAPCIVLGHMLGRVGCFCAGCCYGKPTHSFLGIVFPALRDYPNTYPDYVATGGRAYPTQLYEALFLAVLFTVMVILLFQYKKSGFLLVLYGFAYAVFRFLLEFVRGDDRGFRFLSLYPSQWQSIVLLLVTLALTLLVYKFHIVPFAKAPDPPPAPAAEPLADTAAEPTEKADDAPRRDGSATQPDELS